MGLRDQNPTVGPNLIEIDAARRLIAERVRPVGAETVALEDGLGRVLAEAVTSADDVPGFDNSAMDGFAIRAADTVGAPVELSLIAESRAGQPAERGPGPGEAVAISTGAVVPAGADAVVRVEDTSRAGDRVEIAVTVEPGRNVRRAGEDIRAGSTLLTAGVELGAAEIGVLASVGRAEAECARRPRAAVLTTGDELQPPGEPLRPGAIRNSNAYSVAASVRAAGGELAAVELVPDDAASTRTALEGAMTGDLVVICGGVSVGEHDHVRGAMADLGVEEVFWGVALRPGKPTAFGVAPGGCLVFGLPGNPVSAMVTFHLFVRPAIRSMMGAIDIAHRASAILDESYPRAPSRTHLVRCRIEPRDDGWHARPTGAQGSHVLTSMLGADALAVIPPGSGEVAAGERVEIELLA